MEVILKQDISKLGEKDEIVAVKAGFGRNYLIPKGLAILATPSAKKMLSENLKQRAHKEEKLKEQALAIVKKIENKIFKVGAKTSSTGKIFGSVSPIQVAEAINKKGFEIDRKQISIEGESIKEVGKYTAKIKLHKEVQFELEFEVVSE
jgi:large subunit ribosomal protein L9